MAKRAVRKAAKKKPKAKAKAKPKPKPNVKKRKPPKASKQNVEVDSGLAELTLVSAVLIPE